MTMGDMTIIDAHLMWAKAAGMSKNTLRVRGITLRRMDRDLPHGLDIAAAEEIQEWLARDMAAKTRVSYYSTLKVFYDWAIFNEVLDWSPMTRVRRPKAPPCIPNPVTTEVLVAILRRSAPKFRLVAVLAAYAGLRCAEIASLSRDHVSETMIRVTGKGGKTAEVDTHPRVWTELADFPGSAPFIAQAGGLASDRWVSRATGQYFKRVLKIPATPHMLRHWYGTEILRQTNNLRKTQIALRHSSISSTQGYTQIRSEERRAAIHTLPLLDEAAS